MLIKNYFIQLYLVFKKPEEKCERNKKKKKKVETTKKWKKIKNKFKINKLFLNTFSTMQNHVIS